MTDSVRPYEYYDVAISICSTCYQRVEAKIYFQDGHVYMRKRCPAHGWEKVLIADDVDYYRRSRESFVQHSQMPAKFNTEVKYGCPYDCGLCTDHEQHSCLTLVEICDACNLRCPVCYAASGPERDRYRTLEHIEAMLDAVVANEGEADVVQVSGGEPTIHPDFFAVLDAARTRPIKHLMVNTNGIRIANEPEFAERLAGYMPGFEIYLQFDSLRSRPYGGLRGADLLDVKMRALDRLNELGLSTTLVATLRRGLNDDEIGAIVEFALEQPAVRGVAFQPIQAAGRVDGFDAAEHRLTLSEIRRCVLEQTDTFAPNDIIPVPCHPDRIAMAYALKVAGEVAPLSSMVDPEVLLEGDSNTIVFERDAGLRANLLSAYSARHSPESSAAQVGELLCCLPGVEAPGDLGYENLFRVTIMHFLDAFDFDVRSVKKSCVHIVHPDGRIIPFDTYNLFYRDDLEKERLQPLIAAVSSASHVAEVECTP